MSAAASIVPAITAFLMRFFKIPSLFLLPPLWGTCVTIQHVSTKTTL